VQRIAHFPDQIDEQEERGFEQRSMPSLAPAAHNFRLELHCISSIGTDT
jgi:hypothetical protein